MRKKIFIVFFILFLFFVFNINNESKADFKVEHNGEVVSLPDLPIDFSTEHYILRRDDYWKAYGLWVANEWNSDSTFYMEGHYIHVNGNFSLYRCYDSDMTKWVKVSNNEYINIFPSIDTVLWSSDNIYGEDGKIIYFNTSFNVELNYYEDGNMYQIFTNNFSIDRLNKISCYISADGENYNEMICDVDDISNTFNFYYDIHDNGTYYIKFIDEDNKEQILTVTATDIKEQQINFYLSTEEHTTEPIYLLSNKYYFEGEYDASEDFLNNYDIDLSRGLDSPYEYNPLSHSDSDEKGTFRQYQFKIVTNGIYKLRILNLITGEFSYQTFIVDNIGIKNKYGDDVFYNNYNENGKFDPTPVLFLDYVDTSTVRIRTQPFIFNELIMLECYISSDGENYEKNNNIYTEVINNVSGEKDLLTNEVKMSNLDTYYFYYDVSIDGIYYFKFYNIELKKYTFASIDVNINKFLVDNAKNIDKYPDKFVVWANSHFGILTYPFTFVVNLFGKLSNINYSEPILHIPELKDPINGNKLLDPIDFNFNSVIESEVLRNIHNIYLAAVDFIFIVLFIILCKRTFEEVFSK